MHSSRALWRRTPLPALRQLQTRAHPPVSPSAPAAPSPSEKLVRFIDSEAFYHRHFPETPSAHPGLLANRFLTSADGVLDFCHALLADAQDLLASILAAAPDDAHAAVQLPRHLDRLSDVLCRALDMYAFIRETHPSAAFRSLAQHAHELLYEYMNGLNTNVALYRRLEAAMTNHTAPMLPAARAVGTTLLNDFQALGAHMDPERRAQFVELTQNIAICGHHFQAGAGSVASASVPITAEEYALLLPELQRHCSSGLLGKRTLSLAGLTPYQVLRTCSVASVRHRVWLALDEPPAEQLSMLTRLLQCRAILARTMGYRLFAEYNLVHKMAQLVDHVKTLLETHYAALQPRLAGELAALAKRKLSSSIGDPSPEIHPWDLTYLRTRMATKPSRLQLLVLEYFSVGTVVAGLSGLFKRIYGVEFVPVAMAAGESWHPLVRKLQVVCEREGPIGILYLDLYARREKNGHPAHYSIVCGRRVFDDEPETPASATAATAVHPSGHTLQLPVIALVCDFVPLPHTNNVALLLFQQVETLFHECGHAMHSMLGRTDYHSISGTRTPSDFVEVPLMLMEHFAQDPRVLMLFARHFRTGEPLDRDTLHALGILTDSHLLPGLADLATLKQAAIDMALHEDTRVLDPAWTADATVHAVERHYGVLVDTESHAYAQLGHLNLYGANYYSYVLGRVAARRVWHELFVDDPFSAVGGGRFRALVLQYGGGRDPWTMLSEVLNEPALAAGDQAAMKALATPH